MEEKPDRALRSLVAIVLIGFPLVILLPLAAIKGLTGTLAFFATTLTVILPFMAAIWSANWLNHRLSRRCVLIPWPLVGAATILLPRALIGPPSGGPWLFLLVPLVAAIVGFAQAVFSNA